MMLLSATFNHSAEIFPQSMNVCDTVHSGTSGTEESSIYRLARIAMLVVALSATLLAVAQPGPKPQTIYSALWRVDHNFQATLRIRNVSLVDPITVSPILYMRDGVAYALPPITIPAADIRSININEALSTAPPKLAANFTQFGSVALQFTSGSPVRVSASVELLDVVSSLSFMSQCAARGSKSSSKQVIEGLWWKHDAGVGGFVALTNTTDAPVSGSYQLVTARGRVLPIHAVSLAAHHLQWIDLGDLLAELPASETTGGLRVNYEGNQCNLLVTGGLENAAEGYSAVIPFVSAPSDEKASNRTYASVGLNVRNAHENDGISLRH